MSQYTKSKSTLFLTSFLTILTTSLHQGAFAGDNDSPGGPNNNRHHCNNILTPPGGPATPSDQSFRPANNTADVLGTARPAPAQFIPTRVLPNLSYAVRPDGAELVLTRRDDPNGNNFKPVIVEALLTNSEVGLPPAIVRLFGDPPNLPHQLVFDLIATLRHTYNQVFALTDSTPTPDWSRAHFQSSDDAVMAVAALETAINILLRREYAAQVTVQFAGNEEAPQPYRLHVAITARSQESLEQAAATTGIIRPVLTRFSSGWPNWLVEAVATSRLVETLDDINRAQGYELTSAQLAPPETIFYLPTGGLQGVR